MISVRDQQGLRRLLQSPDWKVVERVIADKITAIQSDERVRDSEWETLKNTVAADYQVRALKDLLQAIYDLASNIPNE